MSFQVSTTRLPQFVKLTVSGPNSIKSFVELIDSVAEETALWGDRRLMVDLRAVEGALTPPEQVFLGELVAQSFPHMERVASVVPSEQITHNSETAARDLGMQLRVFASEEEATEWLRSGLP
ncbi:MAG: STAS/SEC14 domain-containing protein [Ramlibacter sp.]